MPSFVQSFLSLPARSKGIAAVSAVAVLGVAFLLLKLATAPSYTLLSTGLDPAQTGKVTAALDQQGISYELRNNGTALAVQQSQVAQARVALAAQGVDAGGGSQPGFSLFDKSQLGASQFQNQVTYQRALEGQIANTINGVQGVSGATVQLVLPQDDLFSDAQDQATAAVMLGNPADTLQPGATSGIAQLVAHSVKGLKTDNVTITDGSGQLLWPQDGGGGAGGTGTATKQAAQAHYDSQIEANLNALLAQTLGPGKAQVQVNADLNVDKTNLKKLTYSQKGVPLHTQSDVENLKGGSVSAGGAAGTASNVPTYSAGNASGSGNSNYKHVVKSTDWAPNKQVQTTDVAPGAINKLSLALLVDKSVPPATFNALKQTVSAAAGLNTTRGDVLQAAQVPFAKPVTPKAGPVPVSLLGPLKWVGLGIGTLLFLFFMARHLKRREGEAIASPSWLTEIEEPVSLAALEQSTTSDAANAPTIQLPPRAPDVTLNKLDQLMEREPDRVAAQVKQWIAED
jgi:flagellar M-ring protein FliF